MKMKTHIGAALIIFFCLIIVAVFLQSQTISWSLFQQNYHHQIGDPVDSLHGVTVYFNGPVSHVYERNVAPDGYDIGLKWQCVEFVKRYYLQRFGHEMPDAFGHACDFYDKSLPDSAWNFRRGLVQFSNAGIYHPRPDDILVFDAHSGNRFGHVAIISEVYDNALEIVQQNPGPGEPSRQELSLQRRNGTWYINQKNVLGWLGLRDSTMNFATNSIH